MSLLKMEHKTQAKIRNEIMGYLDKKPMAYPEDIAKDLKLDLKTTFETVRELIREKKIREVSS